LYFFGGILIEALDVGDLAGIDVGHLGDGLEAFGRQQLGDHLVDVERFHEELRALGELLLTPLRLLLFGQNIDIPTGKLGRKPHVLAAPPDRQRKLALGDHHLDAVGIFVQHHFGHFGRRQRIDDEGGSILVPLDDVDLLALQLADHRLHTLTAHADAGADRIDRGVFGNDGNFCPGAGISRHRLDLHDAIVDLRDLRPEQQRHEFGTSTGEKDLGPTLLAAHIIDVGPDAVAEPDVFAWNHLVAPDDPLRLLQIDDDVAIFDALDGTANDFADAILELAVLALAFRIAHLLHDHLLGILGGHPAEIRRWQWLSDQIADLGVGIASLGG